MSNEVGCLVTRVFSRGDVIQPTKRVVSIFLAIALALPAPLIACKCAYLSDCGAYSHADLIFTGRVELGTDETSETIRRGTWPFLPGAALSEDDSLFDDRSPDGFRRLKSYYELSLLPAFRSKIAAAANFDELETIGDQLAEEGFAYRVRVIEQFKGAELEMLLDVWTVAHSCGGLPLMDGESYLIYASRRDDGKIWSSNCSGTEHISRAGHRLAYLRLQKSGASDRGRIDGFVTSNERDLRLPFFGGVPAPLTGVTVAIKGIGVERSTTTDSSGEFVLDGLPVGEYVVSLASGESEPVRLLDEGACRHVRLLSSGPKERE